MSYVVLLSLLPDSVSYPSTLKISLRALSRAILRYGLKAPLSGFYAPILLAVMKIA